MAYSSVWNNTRPQGTVAANTIDEEIQQVRIDVNDRLIDLFGMPDFTSDPLKSHRINLGYAVAGMGGYVNFIDDTGANRWSVGIGSTNGAKDYIIYDEVNSITRLTIDHTTGAATFANDLTVSGNIGTPGNLTVNGITKLGVTGTNSGGQLQYISADGVNRWATGLLHSANETRYVLYDNAQGRIVFQADASTSRIGINYGLDVTGGSITNTSTVAGSTVFSSAVSADTASRFYIQTGGLIGWGPGNAGADASLSRTGNAVLTLSGSLIISTTLSLGTNYAGSGIIRLPNNNAIVARNAANNADISLLFVDAGNNVQIANTGQNTGFGGQVTANQFNGSLVGNVTGNVSGSSGSCTGNAASATVLQTPRNINGVSFNGSADITVPAAAGTLTGTTLPALNGSALTNLTGANVTGTVANATNAGHATNSDQLGGTAAASYALLSDTRNFVTTGSVTAHAFFVV